MKKRTAEKVLEILINYANKYGYNDKYTAEDVLHMLNNKIHKEYEKEIENGRT